MTLFLNGDAMPIAQMGPDFLILDNPIEHAPCVAEVVLSVDGNESRWSVRLPEGIRPNQKRVPGAKI
jgi:hypothetical protein